MNRTYTKKMLLPLHLYTWQYVDSLTVPVSHVVQNSATGLANTWKEVEARNTATTNLSQGRHYWD
jgi:hypothetical protein